MSFPKFLTSWMKRRHWSHIGTLTVSLIRRNAFFPGKTFIETAVWTLWQSDDGRRKCDTEGKVTCGAVSEIRAVVNVWLKGGDLPEVIHPDATFTKGVSA